MIACSAQKYSVTRWITAVITVGLFFSSTSSTILIAFIQYIWFFRSLRIYLAIYFLNFCFPSIQSDLVFSSDTFMLYEYYLVVPHSFSVSNLLLLEAKSSHWHVSHELVVIPMKPYFFESHPNPSLLFCWYKQWNPF